MPCTPECHICDPCSLDVAVTEYALEMSGGSMQIRNDDPAIERICPLGQWLGHHLWQGAHVWRRTVVVTEGEGWERVRVKDLRGEAARTYRDMQRRFKSRPHI